MNISFFQVLIFLIFVFLMFGNTQILTQNFYSIKNFFLKNWSAHFTIKNPDKSSSIKIHQEKRDSNP